MQETLRKKPGAQANPGLRWQFAICFFAFILIGANDGAVGVLLPSLMGQYNVNKAQVSLMFLTGTAGYLMAAFSNGLLIERLGRRVLLLIGVSLFSLGAITLLVRPPFILFLIGLFVIGVGVALLDAGLNAYIASLPDNTAVLNYLHAFYGIGALLGPVIASVVLATGLGWNITYLLWVVMGLIVLAGFGRLLHDTPPQDSESAEIKTGNVMSAALRLGLVWLSVSFLFIYVGTEVGLGTWSYSFLLEDRHGLELLSAWSVSGYWLGLTVGRLVMGWFSRKLTKQRLIELCLGGVVLGVLLLWLVPNALVSALGLWIIGFSLGPIFPTVISLLSDLIPARLQASAIGFVAAGGSVGAAFFPLVIGNLAQAFGVWTLMPYTIGLTVVMLGLWFLVARHKNGEKGSNSN